MGQIDNIVNVTVTKQSASVTRAGFGTPMGVFQVPVATQANRFALYGSVQEMTDAGFLPADRAVTWATAIFSQDISPNVLAIGRREEGTAQVDDVEVTVADAGTWTIILDGVTYSYVAGAGDTEQIIAVGLADAINSGVPEAAAVVASVPVLAAFTLTAKVPGEPFSNGGIFPPGSGAATNVPNVPNAAAEDMLTALTAINTENTKDWYGLNIETRNDADITAAAAFLSTLKKVGIFQSKDPDALTSTPANIFDVIALTQNKRVALVWHDDDNEYLDGAWLGRVLAADLDAENGAITWYGKQIVGVPADDLTDGEITSLESYNGNSNTIIGGRSFTQEGTSAEGEFMDVQTTIDWTEFRTQEAVFGRIATTATKIPGTNAGIGSIVNEVLGVLNSGVGIGHYTSDFPPTVTAPNSSQRTEADRNARILRDVVGQAKLAGAIHSTIIQVNVTV